MHSRGGWIGGDKEIRSETDMEGGENSLANSIQSEKRKQDWKDSTVGR